MIFLNQLPAPPILSLLYFLKMKSHQLRPSSRITQSNLLKCARKSFISEMNGYCTVGGLSDDIHMFNLCCAHQENLA